MSISEDEYPCRSYKIPRNGVRTEETPPLIKTKSRIIHCVVNNDVEGLKSLINYPNFFKVTDKCGYPILQIAILANSRAVFDFLLSLDDCPLEALRNKKQTALEIALSLRSGWMHEHFAYSLVKKGAKFDYIFHCAGDSILHCALNSDYLKTARLLAEKGADLNCQNGGGTTPIHLYSVTSDENETLAMLLCLGADPSIPDFTGYRVADLALTSERLSTSMKEILLFYLFDEYSTGYDIPIGTLFNLLVLNHSLLPELLKYVTSVNMNETSRERAGVKSYFLELFDMKPKYLKLLLEKFDYVIDEILNDFLIEADFTHYCYNVPPEQPVLFEMFIQNFDLLLQSQFNSVVIQIINRTKMCKFLEKSMLFKQPQEEVRQLILLLLSYGANICDEDLNMIYKMYGDCEYFRILLHMDIEITDKNQHCDTLMPTLLYDIHFDIETFLDHCSEPSPKALIELLNYFAHRKVKDFCSSLRNKEIDAKVKNLPPVPLLVELARNEVRKFLIQRFKITNSMQFYTLIKHLPISKIHEKIITFEKKLYQN